MKIIFNVSTLECSFVYDRKPHSRQNDELDKKFIKLAQRLSSQISSEPFSINVNVSEGLSNSSVYQTYKIINLIFRCFDKDVGGKTVHEKKFQLTICFDKILDKKILDEIFKEDVYINLEPQICDLLETLVIE